MPDKSSTHTPEPWDTQADPDIDDSTIYVHTIEGDDAPVLVATFPWHDTGEANAARIVRCVNDCAGIPDPAAELANLRAVAEAGAPPAVKIALKLLLNHVEPGWDNAVAVVQIWLNNPSAFADKASS